MSILSRVEEQKQALMTFATESNMETVLSPSQWRLLSKVVQVLGVFKEATLLISNKNAMLSEVLPMIKSLKKAIQSSCDSDDNGVRNLKRKLLDSLEHRFAEHTQDDKLLLATAVDPR